MEWQMSGMTPHGRVLPEGADDRILAKVPRATTATSPTYIARLPLSSILPCIPWFPSPSPILVIRGLVPSRQPPVGLGEELREVEVVRAGFSRRGESAWS